MQKIIVMDADIFLCVINKRLYLIFFFGWYYVDIDDCQDVTCQNGGSCRDGLNSYFCSCLPGYTSVHCEKGNTLTHAHMHAQRDKSYLFYP